MISVCGFNPVHHVPPVLDSNSHKYNLFICLVLNNLVLINGETIYYVKTPFFGLFFCVTLSHNKLFIFILAGLFGRRSYIYSSYFMVFSKELIISMGNNHFKDLLPECDPSFSHLDDKRDLL